jgi:hypothetical protein
MSGFGSSEVSFQTLHTTSLLTYGLVKTTSRAPSPESVDGHDWHAGITFDIGGSTIKDTLLEELTKKFLWKEGQFQEDRLLPASVLHDEKGLVMWSTITSMPRYYQTNDEIELLHQNRDELVKSLAGIDTLIDLGCGYVI